MVVNHYRDTLMNDTSALVVIANEVSMNELQRTRMEFLNRRSTIIYTNLQLIEKPKIMFYGGLLVSYKSMEVDFKGSIFAFGKGRLGYGICYSPFSNTLEFCLIKLFSR